MNIALFGTSADPPTVGHQTILSWIAQYYDLCAVWVSNNPFKVHRAELPDRVTMLKLTIEAIEPKLTNLQLHQELSHSRTLITLNQAKQLWTAANFTLVVGADLIEQLPSWYGADELLSQVKLLVIPRLGYALPESSLEIIRHKGTEVEIADLVVPAVSSSSFRDRGEITGLSSTVANFIQQEHLYAWQEAKNAIH